MRTAAGVQKHRRLLLFMRYMSRVWETPKVAAERPSLYCPAGNGRAILILGNISVGLRREKQRSRMQECKDKVFCILALLNEQQQQKERISFACMQSFIVLYFFGEMVYTDSEGYGVCLEKSSMLWQMPSGNRRVQAVEKPKYKVLGQAIFKKLAWTRGGAPRRPPQRAKHS